jgi:hypothetical protein
MTELKAIANDVFKRFPKEDKVFVTSDGQVFLDEAHAKNHAKNNRTGKELGLETFLRGDSGEEKTAAGWIEYIATLTSVNDVKDILSGETKGKKRKSVIEAAEKKIAELSKTE